MAHIISIIQVKGGAGRSTIATNLAGMLSAGAKVALVDCDMPQGTSASWGAIRLADKPASLTIATAANHQELVEVVQRLNAEHDYLVLDGPPRIAEMTRAALILSHLSLIPLGASAAELWATSDLLSTIKEARTVKPDVDARIAWTRFRGSTSSARELSDAAQGELGLKELRAKLGYRVAFSDAMARGLTVAEWPEKVARLEMQVFRDEVIKILRAVNV
jgi:chromosome partitioning protein